MVRSWLRLWEFMLRVPGQDCGAGAVLLMKSISNEMNDQIHSMLARTKIALAMQIRTEKI